MTPWLLLPLTSVVVLGIAFRLVPRVSADTVPLGVRVPSGHAREQVVLEAIAAYRRWVLALTVLAAALVVGASIVLERARGQARSLGVGLLSVSAVVVMTVACGLVISHCAAPIRRAKEEQRWYDGVPVGLVASLTPGERSSRVRWVWFAVAGLILAGTAAMAPRRTTRCPTSSSPTRGRTAPTSGPPRRSGRSSGRC